MERSYLSSILHYAKKEKRQDHYQMLLLLKIFPYHTMEHTEQGYHNGKKNLQKMKKLNTHSIFSTLAEKAEFSWNMKLVVF